MSRRLDSLAFRGAVLAALALALPAPAAARRAAAAPAAADEGGPKVASRSVLVLRNRDGKVLFARDANAVRPIASLTKIMAALVVRRRGLRLDRGTTINRDDWRVALKGARTRLELSWTYRNRDLLVAALLASDNRAVSALGRAVGLHAAALVQAMNEEARRMRLRHTRFRGPVGIDPGNVSTAWEVARMLRRAARDPVLGAIMGRAEAVVKPMRGYITLRYRNTNRFVGRSKRARVLATKTGYNSAAGYCVAAVIDVAGFGKITVVLLGAPRKADRVRDQQRIVAWVRRNARRFR